MSLLEGWRRSSSAQAGAIDSSIPRFPGGAAHPKTVGHSHSCFKVHSDFSKDIGTTDDLPMNAGNFARTSLDVVTLLLRRATRHVLRSCFIRRHGRRLGGPDPTHTASSKSYTTGKPRSLNFLQKILGGNIF